VGTVRKDRCEKEPNARNKNETYENSTEKIHRVTETEECDEGQSSLENGIPHPFSYKVSDV
jgi:hypothetical protein